MGKVSTVCNIVSTKVSSRYREHKYLIASCYYMEYGFEECLTLIYMSSPVISNFLYLKVNFLGPFGIISTPADFPLFNASTAISAFSQRTDCRRGLI